MAKLHIGDSKSNVTVDEGRLNTVMTDSLGNEPIDSNTAALNVVNYAHHEAHAGSHFFILGYDTMASSQVKDFCFVTPVSTKEVHMGFGVSGEGVTLDVYEGTSYDTSGTSITPYNNNRNSTATSIANIYLNSVVGTLGTNIGGITAGSGGNPASNRSGNAGTGEEIILKTNTKYLFRLTSLSADNPVGFAGEWYEHTPKA